MKHIILLQINHLSCIFDELCEGNPYFTVSIIIAKFLTVNYSFLLLILFYTFLHLRFVILKIRFGIYNFIMHFYLILTKNCEIFSNYKFKYFG